MRPITTIRAIGLVAAGAMLVAACGGNAATTAPTTAAATSAPATTVATLPPVPTEVPGASSLPGASFDLSSFHGDQALESLFPKQIGGETLTVLSMTGDQFLGAGTTSPEISAALQALGKTPADLSVAFAGTTKISVIAFRVKGAPADALFNAFKAAQTDQFTTESTNIAGKNVTKITPADSAVAYVYTTGDTMFIVGGAGDTEAPADLLTEAFSKLP
jgi:hypothetical protein